MLRLLIDTTDAFVASLFGLCGCARPAERAALIMQARSTVKTIACWIIECRETLPLLHSRLGRSEVLSLEGMLQDLLSNLNIEVELEERKIFGIRKALRRTYHLHRPTMNAAAFRDLVQSEATEGILRSWIQSLTFSRGHSRGPATISSIDLALALDDLRRYQQWLNQQRGHAELIQKRAAQLINTILAEVQSTAQVVTSTLASYSLGDVRHVWDELLLQIATDDAARASVSQQLADHGRKLAELQASRAAALVHVANFPTYPRSADVQSAEDRLQVENEACAASNVVLSRLESDLASRSSAADNALSAHRTAANTIKSQCSLLHDCDIRLNTAEVDLAAFIDVLSIPEDDAAATLLMNTMLANANLATSEAAAHLNQCELWHFSSPSQHSAKMNMIVTAQATQAFVTDVRSTVNRTHSELAALQQPTAPS